jgi:hypothetical protein
VLSGRAARGPDSALRHARDARRMAAMRQRRAAVWARCGAATADRWGPLSVISELKITPKEISSNQIVGD